jgi:pimeloyl-ACP methyl ester carboxylesterase
MVNECKNLEVILVHGGWSDASCWSKVIQQLRKHDVLASATQLCLNSFESDVLSLAQHIESRSASQLVLVGHSYGGAVITEIASRYESVRALVYVAASAPVAGQSFGDFMQHHPSPVPIVLTPDSYGLLWANSSAFTNVLAHDLPTEENYLLHAVQKPVASALLGDSVNVEGWRQKQCWYVVAEEDRLFAPADQHALAKQLNAKTRSISSGHFVPRSRPEELSEVILEVVRSTVVELNF